MLIALDLRLSGGGCACLRRLNRIHLNTLHLVRTKHALARIHGCIGVSVLHDAAGHISACVHGNTLSDPLSRNCRFKAELATDFFLLFTWS